MKGTLSSHYETIHFYQLRRRITFCADVRRSLGLHIGDFDAQDGTDTSASDYNTVTHTNWRFVSPGLPAPPTIQFDLNSDPSGLVWQDTSQPFLTTITAVPEPASACFFSISLISLMLRRNK